MSNGAAPTTVPGSGQTTTLTQPAASTEAPYIPAPEAGAAPAAETQIPEAVQQELDQLRGVRDSVAPLLPLVEQLGGDGLYQHYANYASMLQERQQPAATPAPEPQQQDIWADQPEAEPAYVQELRAKVEAQGTQLNQMTHNVGVDKVAQHSERFFRDEFPQLTPEERKHINDGMGRVFNGYTNSESGRAFLNDPQYGAVRTLALNQMTPKMLEEVYRRKFDAERTNRVARSTDSYRPVQPGQEEVDMGDDFLSSWEASAERVRREGG